MNDLNGFEKAKANKLNFAAIHDVRTPSIAEGTQQSQQAWGDAHSLNLEEQLQQQIPLELS